MMLLAGSTISTTHWCVTRREEVNVFVKKKVCVDFSSTIKLQVIITIYYTIIRVSHEDFLFLTYL